MSLWGSPPADVGPTDSITLNGCALDLRLPQTLRARRNSLGERFVALDGPGGSLFLVTCRDNAARTFDADRAMTVSAPDTAARPAVRLLGKAQLAGTAPCVLFRKVRVSGGRTLETVHAVCATREYEYRIVLIPNLLPQPHESLIGSVLKDARFTRTLTQAVDEGVFRKRAIGLVVVMGLLVCGVLFLVARRMVRARRIDTGEGA